MNKTQVRPNRLTFELFVLQNFIFGNGSSISLKSNRDKGFPYDRASGTYYDFKAPLGLTWSEIILVIAPQRMQVNLDRSEGTYIESGVGRVNEW